MYTVRPQPHHRRWPYVLGGLLLVIIYAAWALLRPLPPLQPVTVHGQLKTAITKSKLTWPAEPAAVGIVGSPILETHGDQTPVPIASTAKTITALVILDKKPLKLGQQGPIITLSKADKALYDTYFSKDGSLVPVTDGEKISEYQMLQAIMLPSANNMADSLAIWTFGSLANYSTAANAYLAKHGVKHTRVGNDASGLDPSTISTATDLVRIGKLVMQNPVLAQIVGQKTATGIPVANTINNVNGLIGIDNIVGIKTGNSDEAGGVFISAAKIDINKKPVIIVTAVVKAQHLVAAMNDSRPLIRSAQTNFTEVKIVKAGDVVGYYKMPWGGSLAIKTTKDLGIKTWNSSSITASTNLKEIPANSKAGQPAGNLTIKKSAISDQKNAPLELSDTPSKPNLTWRITNPF